jgi:hypothetical protein
MSTMANAREALGRLRAAARDGRLEALCRRHGIRLLGAFGSATDPSWPDPHDLDVAFQFEHGIRGDIVAVINGLVDLLHFQDVDVMDLGRADAVARTSGLVGGEPLYESQPGAFARAQEHAVKERLDTAWLRRIDLELLAS